MTSSPTALVQRLTHVIVYNRIPFLFYCCIIFHHMRIPHFIYICIDRHLDSFLYFWDINNTANEHFAWICVFNLLEHIARDEVAKLQDNSVFNI